MAETPTILVADDDEEWRQLIMLAVQGAGYRVRMAHNGKMVMPLAAESRPDGFILDHDLGDMTGAELCRDIKATPQYQGVPVIMLTAHATVLNKLISGFPPDQFVVKTGSMDELLVILETLVPL